jgi:hypothetical protein
MHLVPELKSWNLLVVQAVDLIEGATLDISFLEVRNLSVHKYLLGTRTVSPEKIILFTRESGLNSARKIAVNAPSVSVDGVVDLELRFLTAEIGEEVTKNGRRVTLPESPNGHNLCTAT